MGDQPPRNVRHHDSHDSLVGMPQPANSNAYLAPIPLDAIIVPASRTAPNFEHAIGLAHAAGCKLVAICSHDAQARHLRSLAASLSFEDLVAIDLPDDYSHPFLGFETSGWLSRELRDACSYKTNLSAKRNIGLLLAAMLGWTRIFYLDDDIRHIERSDLRRTVGMLDDGYTVVGLRVTKFPDNSVVCHAHRSTGGEQQGVFVTGSALAVDVKHAPGFFPEIYNEDWLFFYSQAVNGRLALSDCHATQLVYDPFDTPNRAAWQEFGDVLAEGIYGLLHDHGDLTAATSNYWKKFIRARRDFLDAILARTDDPHVNVQPGLIECVESARKILAHITPGMCQRYVQLWQRDQKTWAGRVASIEGTAMSVEAALRELGLQMSRPTGEDTLPMLHDHRYGPPDGPYEGRHRPVSPLRVIKVVRKAALLNLLPSASRG